MQISDYITLQQNAIRSIEERRALLFAQGEAIAVESLDAEKEKAQEVLSSLESINAN